MKYAILTFLIAIASMMSLKGQYLERGIIKTDSAEYAVEDVYVQPAREEVRQKKTIGFLQKKIDKLKKLGHKKQELIGRQAELIDTIASLQSRIEALQEENDLLHQEMIESAKNAIDLANVELTKLDKEVRRLRKRGKLLILLIISESIILIIII